MEYLGHLDLLWVNKVQQYLTQRMSHALKVALVEVQPPVGALNDQIPPNKNETMGTLQYSATVLPSTPAHMRSQSYRALH